MLKSYKYRIYPNKQQIEQIQKTFGCCRFIYNQVLEYRKNKYELNKESMNKISCNNYCNQVMKVEYSWLKEIDKFALTNSIYNMDNAYQKFFKEHAGYPKFKNKKNSKRSYTTNFTNGNIEVSDKKIKLPKLKWIKAKVHREFSGQIKTATISQVPSGKYYVSILVETTHVVDESTGCAVGIDLGIKDLLITSNGEKFNNIRPTKMYEKNLLKNRENYLANKKAARILISKELKWRVFMKKFTIPELII